MTNHPHLNDQELEEEPLPKKYFKFRGLIELEHEMNDRQQCNLMNQITTLLDLWGENTMSAQVVDQHELD